MVTASDGLEALERIKERGDEIKLVISDLLMPTMSGLELFDALKEMGAPQLVILMTGFHDTSTDFQMSSLRERGLAAWMRKPIRVQELLANVARTVEGDRRADLID